MFGTGEILVIFVVILILFGGKKLPEFAKSLGKGIREFKKACNGDEEGEISHAPTIETVENEESSLPSSNNSSKDSS